MDFTSIAIQFAFLALSIICLSLLPLGKVLLKVVGKGYKTVAVAAVAVTFVYGQAVGPTTLILSEMVTLSITLVVIGRADAYTVVALWRLNRRVRRR
jgi:hypothetical protein